MRALVTILGLLAAPAAMAGSELQLKSSMPVVLLLDGENKGTVQPMEPLLIDIESGVHELKLKGVLGKTLYERELIFDDQTRTELVWQRRDLRLGGVVKLDEESDEAVADDESDEADEASEQEDVAKTPPPPAKPEEALAVPADAPEEPESTPAATESRPELERPEAPPVKAAPPAKPPAPKAPPVVKDVKAPTPPAASPSAGSVVIEATPGMDLTITHGSQRLRVTVENGELVVEDANGTEIHFPTDGDAW